MQYEKFGKFLNKKRLLLGKSLNGFAVEVDVDSAIISRIENGKQDIKLTILTKIAKGFNQTTSEFLGEFEKYNYFVFIRLFKIIIWDD